MSRKRKLRVQSTELVRWVREEDADAYRRAGWTIQPRGPGRYHDLPAHGVLLATMKLDKPLRRYL